MSLEKGYGPVNFGTTQVELLDGSLSGFQAVFIKAERVTMATSFLLLLGFSSYNIYSYLWKGKRYSSYPLVLGYINITLYSIICVLYELYMGFACGGQDCFTHYLISIMPEYRRTQEKHQNYLT